MDGISDEDDTIEVLYKCRKCMFTASTPAGIKHHVKIEHKSKNISSESKDLTLKAQDNQKKIDHNTDSADVDTITVDFFENPTSLENESNAINTETTVVQSDQQHDIAINPENIVDINNLSAGDNDGLQFIEQNNIDQHVSTENNIEVCEITQNATCSDATNAFIDNESSSMGYGNNVLENVDKLKILKNNYSVESVEQGVKNIDTKESNVSISDIKQEQDIQSKDDIILSLGTDTELINADEDSNHTLTNKTVAENQSEANHFIMSLTATTEESQTTPVVTCTGQLFTSTSSITDAESITSDHSGQKIIISSLEKGLDNIVCMDEEIHHASGVDGNVVNITEASHCPTSESSEFVTVESLNQRVVTLEQFDQGFVSSEPLVTNINTLKQAADTSNSLNTDLLNKLDDGMNHMESVNGGDQNIMYFVNAPLPQQSDNSQLMDIENQNQSFNVKELLDRGEGEVVGTDQLSNADVVQIIGGSDQQQEGVDIMVGPTGQQFVIFTNTSNSGQNWISDNKTEEGLIGELHPVSDNNGIANFTVPMDIVSKNEGQFTSSVSQTNGNGLQPAQVRDDLVIHDGYQTVYQNFIQQAGQTDDADFHVPGWISQADLESGNYPITETKELFLCGQCNMSFITMEQCKGHIEEKHHLEEEGTDISQQQISGNKCSIGVQASKGPPRSRARKKPISIDLDSENEEIMLNREKETWIHNEKQQEELAEELEEVSDDGEFRTDLQGRRARSKRRIKTPRHLLDEYFIGKKKSKSETLDEELNQAKEPFNWDDIGIKPKKNKRRKDDSTIEDTNLIKEPADIIKIINSEENEKEENINISHQRETVQHKRNENDTSYSDGDDEDYKPSKEEMNQKSEDEMPSTEDEKTNIEVKERIYPQKKTAKPRKERLLRGERLVPKFELAEELRTPKHTYSIRCKYKSCRGRFVTKESYDFHLGCHRRRPGRTALACSVCEKQFQAWSTCRYHLWREHKIDVDLYGCEMCSFKTDMACKLDVHKVVHLQDRPYICKECGRGFKQPGQLRNHEVLHEQIQQQEGDKEDAWFQKKKCEYCENEFANSKSLKNHIVVVHGKLRPYNCPQCNHTASSRAGLQLHLRIHTGEKPYSCDLCKFTASDHNTLRRHRMRHTGEKPYRCPHCTYACIQAIALKTHIKNKHNDSPGVYHCHICQYSTINQNLYNTHMSDHDKGLPITTNIGRRSRKIVENKPASQMTKYACAKCFFSTPDMTLLMAHFKSCTASIQAGVSKPCQSLLRQAVNTVFGRSQTTLTVPQSEILQQKGQQIIGNTTLPSTYTIQSSLSGTSLDNTKKIVIKAADKQLPETVVLKSVQGLSGNVIFKSQPVTTNTVTVDQIPSNTFHMNTSHPVNVDSESSATKNIQVHTVATNSISEQLQVTNIELHEPSVNKIETNNSKKEVNDSSDKLELQTYFRKDSDSVHESLGNLNTNICDSGESSNIDINSKVINITLPDTSAQSVTVTAMEDKDESQTINVVVSEEEFSSTASNMGNSQNENHYVTAMGNDVVESVDDKFMSTIQIEDGKAYVLESVEAADDILQSLQQEGAFVYAEDGSLQPLNLSELANSHLVKGVRQQENGEVHLIVE